MRYCLFIPFYFFACMAYGQDLTGTWEGSGGGANYAKICIIRYNNTYIGYTYDEGMGYCKANLLAQYNPDTKKFKGVNMGMIEKTALHSQSRYNLHYEIINGVEYLRGSIGAKTVGARIMSFNIPMPASYRKVNNAADTTIYMKEWLAKNIPADGNSIAAIETLAKNDGNDIRVPTACLKLRFCG